MLFVVCCCDQVDQLSLLSACANFQKSAAVLDSFDFDHCLKEDCEKEKEGWDAHDCRYEECYECK